ncbi:roadblock/LC7 domain-containing protein [Streptomyces sp. NPDC057638]|uniref:roadblock/LC7 domain-containing protein n=1 Tax=Streptomyces sp. NPDC057638 TaxID=3346190 RepID=UPI00369D605A
MTLLTSIPKDTRQQLVWLLDQLVSPGVVSATLAATDGLVLSHTDGISRDDAEALAAAVSGLWSLGRAQSHLVGGGLRQQLLEYDGGMLLLSAAGEQTALAVVTGPAHEVEVDVVAHRMNELAAQVGPILSAPPRRADGPGRS